jgi:hypothetical protein
MEVGTSWEEGTFKKQDTQKEESKELAWLGRHAKGRGGGGEGSCGVVQCE